MLVLSVWTGGLTSLTTNLIEADASRTEKTICMAAPPSLKAFGIGDRDLICIYDFLYAE